jgi:hypothetical protein
MKTQHIRVAQAAILASFLLAACSHSTNADSATQAAPKSPAGQSYTSTTLAVPLTVTVDRSLKSPPEEDSRTMLTWDSATDPEKKIRFFIPVTVYPPGSSKPVAPPSDYAGYIKGLAKAGAQLTDTKTATIGGRPATELSAASVEPAGPDGYWDATIGCPAPGVDKNEDCYGILPDYVLRMAIVNVNGTTLVAWARMPAGTSDLSFFATFDTMLTSVQFG